MNTPSLPELRAQLDSIDTVLRKYVRMRAILIEVIAFMEDDQEQEHLRLVRERTKVNPAAADAEEASRMPSAAFRPKPPAMAEDLVRRPNPIMSTMSVEA